MSRPVPISPAAAAAPAEKVEKIENMAIAAEPHQNAAEMANQLERRRANEPDIAPEAPAPAKDEQIGQAVEQRRTPPEQQAAETEAKPTRSKTLYDSLEEEMASLLGRPPGKT
jgi:hypothetical protein